MSLISDESNEKQPTRPKSMIPRIFHFIFGLKPDPQEFHLVHYLCIRSCLELNHPLSVFFYYRHEPFGLYWERIKRFLRPIRVNPGRKAQERRMHHAHQSDFLRLEILNAFGGVYADMDTIFVQKLPRELYASQFVMGKEGGHGLCNAFIMARKGSFFGTRWYADMPGVFGSSWNHHSVVYPGRLAAEYPDSIRIEPQESFTKHLWDEEGLHRLFIGRDTHLEKSYSLHLWASLAWDKYLAGITEESIREGTSTYISVAQRYLG